jgi:hypothetical protein
VHECWKGLFTRTHFLLDWSITEAGYSEPR